MKAPMPYGSLPLNTSIQSTAARANTTGIVGNSRFPKVIGKDFDPSTAHKMSEVDKVHALGIKGAGVKIAIIDSGIDYRHPSLGGGFGPGHKVIGGYDFVGDWYAGAPWIPPVEDDDPLASCLDGGHGTHVAGIIGMQDPEGFGFGLTGVAPDAEILSYRVFSCAGAATTEGIMRALQRAGDDGADVINMSLGGATSFQSTDPFSAMISGLRSRGVATIVSNGNDGQGGIYYTSSPAVAEGAIAVGSISNTKFPVTYKGKNSRGRDFKYASVWPIEETEPLDVYLVSATHPLGCSWERYAALEKEISNKSMTFLLIDGPECFTGTWYYFNYRYIAFLNNNAEAFADQYYLDTRNDADNSQFINLDTADGTVTRSMYEKAGGYGKYKWTFGQVEATSSKQVLTGGMMSNFSSFGPPIDTMVLKPQLSAPGGNILSLWPVGNYSGYAIISGTSMSAPFVTGCYALIKSKFPKLSVSEIQDLMQTTSVPVSWVPNTSILSTTVHQGSGLVNAYRAITYETSISPGELSIGDTDDYVNKPRNFTITNKSSRSKSYIISHQGAGYAEHFPYPDLLPDPNHWYFWGQPQYARYGSVSFSQNSVMLAPGQSTTIQVSFTPPSGVDASRNPITSGFIKVTNNNDNFVIPYAGLPYSRFSAEYFDTSNNTGFPYPMSTVDYYYPNITVSGDLHVYTWAEIGGGSVPWVIINFFHLTQELRMDILPANTTFVPDYYGFDPKFEFEYQPSEDPLSSNFIGVPTYGNADRRFMMEPQAGWYGWFSKMVKRDGEESKVQLKKGDYRVLVSIRRWDGDVTKRETWSTYLSPVVRYIDV
ncbi:peptidase S8/S53 domain-containing protein [Rhexocercosporidium sp. MPI-PUGE-AT-0058]|nr:peptidase S8/S53 domain-containing protein [Rhexocercosporidium sp. MPI-PUGE-AT-0058]